MIAVPEAWLFAEDAGQAALAATSASVSAGGKAGSVSGK